MSQPPIAGLINALYPSAKRIGNVRHIALWTAVGVAACVSMLLRVCVASEDALYWGHCGALATVTFVLVSAVCFSRFALCGAGRSKGWFVALSIVISMLNVVGQSFDTSNSLALFYSSAPNAAVFAFRVLGGAVFFYAVFCLLADVALCVMTRQKTVQANVAILGHEITLPLQIGFIALCWLPYLIVFFPGSMPTDTARQLGQWFGTGGVPLDNHFPYLTTVLYGTVYSAGNAIEGSGIGGMFALTVLQYVFGLVAFGAVLLVLRKVLAPKWLQIAGTLFVALFPIIPTYVVSISKDYLHALCVAVFCAQLLFLVISTRNGSRSGKLASWWAIGLLALLVCLTRNNGVVVAGVGLLAAAIALRSLKGAGCLVAVLVAFLCWNSVVLQACNVQPTEPREALSIPAQVVARSYAMGYEPSASDAAVLVECTSCNLHDLAALYNPRISDPAKSVVAADKTQVLQYVGASLGVAVAHPGNALAAALNTTYGFWYPGCLGTYWAEDIPYYSDDPWSLIDSGWFAGADWADEWNNAHKLQCKVLHAIHLLIPGVSHLYRPGTYCWFILFVLAFALQFKANRKAAAVVLLPLLGLFATLVAGPCTSLRYTLPFIFSLPVMLAVLFCHPYGVPQCSLAKTRDR